MNFRQIFGCVLLISVGCGTQQPVSELNEAGSAKSYQLIPEPGTSVEKYCSRIFSKTFGERSPRLAKVSCITAIPNSLARDKCKTDVGACLTVKEVPYPAGTHIDQIKPSKEELQNRINTAREEILEQRSENCPNLVSSINGSATYGYVAYYAAPLDPKVCQSYDVALELLTAAEEALAEGDLESSQELIDMALGVSKVVADIAIGLTPVGRYKDLTEAFFGHSVLPSFEELDTASRIINVVGAVSIGGSTLKLLAKASGKLNFIKRAKTVVSSADELVDAAGDVLKGWRKNHKILAVTDADEVNKRLIEQGYKAPYKSGTKIVEFSTKAEGDWVRVHGAGSQAEGSWLMKEEAIKGLRPLEIQKKYSLPGLPTHVTDVKVPAGTRMNRGHVAENFGGGEGAIQYHLQDRLPSSSFANTRPL